MSRREGGSPPSDLSFEHALERLEAIVARLEEGDLALEAALAAFEEGVALTRHCAERLEAAERRIEVLVREGDGLAARPFVAAGEAEGEPLVDAEAYLAECAALLHPFLDAAVPAADAPPERLHAAVRHLLFPGGKRVRPALVFAAAEALGAPPERALPAAAAVELIHTYSLVHDDLPCMDDDAERRGRPTVHVAFDEATAVLAGDALQAAAFEVLARGAGRVGAARAAAGVAELAAAAGSRHLVGGQADDLAWDGPSADAGPDADPDADPDAGPDAGPDADPDAEAERIASIHRRKTAALVAASTALGAHAADAPEGEVARLRAFGLEVGLAFQLADDLLDHGRDECSLARVLGPEAARARVEAWIAAALARVAGLGEAAEPLRELARFAGRRSR